MCLFWQCTSETGIFNDDDLADGLVRYVHFLYDGLVKQQHFCGDCLLKQVYFLYDGLVKLVWVMAMVL